jgi:PhnB protein
MQVQPYLNFNGRCEEAIEFYKKAVGAKVTRLMRFKDAPPGQAPAMNPAFANNVMHANLLIGESPVLMSDGRCEGSPSFKGISLSLTASNDAEVQRIFAALSDGGKVDMPLAKTFFSSQFGMLHDRFGLLWMVLVEQ